MGDLHDEIDAMAIEIELTINQNRRSLAEFEETFSGFSPKPHEDVDVKELFSGES